MDSTGETGHIQRKPKLQKNGSESVINEDSSPSVKMFQSYQLELDAKHDKYERLVKKSRDLTIESKRIIFLLHRSTSSAEKAEVLVEAENRLHKLLNGVINDIAMELTKKEVYQFLRAFSPGLQEFVEAVSFYHYLRNGNLIDFPSVCNPGFTDTHDTSEETDGQMISKGNVPVSDLLTPIDFVLGVADLTGELMRKCINSVANGDIAEPFKLCCVLQNIYEAFLRCNNVSREMKRKLFTLKCSLEKVENACYAIKIRGSEIPKHMLADFFSREEEHKDISADCDV